VGGHGAVYVRGLWLALGWRETLSRERRRVLRAAAANEGDPSEGNTDEVVNDTKCGYGCLRGVYSGRGLHVVDHAQIFFSPATGFSLPRSARAGEFVIGQVKPNMRRPMIPGSRSRNVTCGFDARRGARSSCGFLIGTVFLQRPITAKSRSTTERQRPGVTLGPRPELVQSVCQQKREDQRNA